MIFGNSICNRSIGNRSIGLKLARNRQQKAPELIDSGALLHRNAKENRVAIARLALLSGQRRAFAVG